MSLYEFGGTHVLCDLTSVGDDAIRDHGLILDAVAGGIRACGATMCGLQVKEFEPSGLTALYLLSESHVSIHTYPEDNALFLDAFTCGERCQPERIVDTLIAALGRCEHRTSVMRRGIGRMSRPAPRLDTGLATDPAHRAAGLVGASLG